MEALATPIETKLTKNQQHYQRYKQTYINNQTKYTCECGSVLRKDAKTGHLKTNKHKNLMEIIELKKKYEQTD